jgi:hypothetical protein
LTSCELLATPCTKRVRHSGAGNHGGEHPPAANQMALIAAAHAGEARDSLPGSSAVYG